MTNSLRIRIVLNFSAIVFASWSADAAEITLKPSALAHRAIVRLGDVAEVRAQDGNFVSQLQEIALFPAPATGRTRTMYMRELRELLVLNGFDVNGLEFSGARMVRVKVGDRATLQPQRLTQPSRQEGFVVAVRQLKRGDIIREADVELRSLDEPPRRIKAATSIKEVIGREVTRLFLPEQPIDQRQLRRPLLVRRGQAVQVKAKAAGVVITTTARATEEGALGDIIVLQSIENREKYAAQVTGLQRAEIYVSGTRVSDPAATVSTLPARRTLPVNQPQFRR